jgi:hypothetical protein
MKRTLILLGSIALALPCAAITIVGAPPPAGKGAPPKMTAAKVEQARDDSAGMRRGTIEALNVNGGTFHMYGQKMTFDAKRVKIFGRDGKATTVYALHKGGKLRFTMDATDPMHRRVAAIYVD